MSKDASNAGLTRRALIKLGGMSLAGFSYREQIPAAGGQGSAARPARKPMYLPPEGSLDPAAHSRAEILFWTDIMMEHAAFFAMLMPGPEVASQRSDAEAFQRTFQSHFDKTRSAVIDRSNFAALNRSTAGLIKPFIEFKQRLLQAQNSGSMRSLVFSSFFDHTAREAVRATHRLERLATGDVASSYAEIVDFWTDIMSEHSGFISHLLDPQEQDLTNQAADESAIFQGLRQGNRERPLPRAEIVLAAEELMDFQAALQQGIETGRIKSIIHPALADHIRRETLKFLDELNRSNSKT